MITKNFKNLLIFYLSFLLLFSFSNSIIPAHYLIQGITFKDMALGQILNFVPVILLLFFTKKLLTRNSWIIAIIAYLLFILFLVKIDSRIQFLFARFLGGTIFFYFFLPYNIAHFKFTLKEHIGSSSAIMFSLLPIIGIIAPLLAGLFTKYNVNAVWVVTFIIGIFSIALTKLQKNFKIIINLKESFKEISSTKWLILFEGIWEALIFTAIPIFTLLFIKTYLGYAIFVSYIAAIGAVANLILGKVTDKIGKRAVFLYPITIALGIITLFFPIAIKSYIPWIISVGLINLLISIFWNLSTTIVVDSVSDVTKAMPAREFLLAVGRIVGSIFVLLSIIFETQPKFVFIVLACAIFIYPLIIVWNTKIIKRYKYF